MPGYATRLHEAIRKKQTPALVGLDPRFNDLPTRIVELAMLEDVPDYDSVMAKAYEMFCFEVIDIVAPLVSAVKPQAAFFEELGPPGCLVLQRVIRRAREAGLIVILDAKRGDIGSTAEAYARGYLAGEDPNAAHWGADALTVNPYLGVDTLEPFVKVCQERNAGIYVLVKTSNPGSGDFQDRESGGNTLYGTVAAAVEKLSAATMVSPEVYGAVGAVVGATYPQQLTAMRSAMPHCPLLVPGYGNQGGTAADVAGAFRPDGLGALVNSSRAINYAHKREPWATYLRPDQWQEAVLEATQQMIAELAACTPAGILRNEQPEEDEE